MGKAEVEPVLMSSSESDSDSDHTSMDDTDEDVELQLLDPLYESSDRPEEGAECSPRSRPRHRKGPSQRMMMPCSMYMMAPWAPMPFLRRSWTPDRSCPQGNDETDSKKEGQRKRRRCQSVPQPSCSTALPPLPGKCCKPHKNEATKAAQKAIHRWLRWQAFMKYLMDEHSQIDSDVTTEKTAEPSVCDDRSDGEASKLSDNEKGGSSLTWDDNPHCVRFSTEADVCNPELPCVMASVEIPNIKKVDEELKQASNIEDRQYTMEAKSKIFLELVRKMGVARWMLNVLANHKVEEANNVDKNVLPVEKEKEKSVIQEKRKHFREMIKKLGPDRWMVDALLGEVNTQKPETKQINDGAKSANPRRARFRQVVGKLGSGPWMLRVLENQGVPGVEKGDVPVLKKPSAPHSVATPEKRKELRDVVKEIGPQPWMVKVVINQAKSAEEINTFRKVVRRMGPSRWMLKVMANNGVKNVDAADTTVFEKPGAIHDAPSPDLRKEFRCAVRQIGPKPWMPRVVINQATVAEQKRMFGEVVAGLGPAPWMLRVMANNGVQNMKEAQMTAVKMHAANHEPVTMAKRAELRKVITELGPKPWMANIVVNQAKLASKVKQHGVDQERKNFREVVVKLGPASWMLEEMTRHGVLNVEYADTSVFSKPGVSHEAPTTEQLQEFHRAIETVGPKPWMVNVVINQAKLILAKKIFKEVVITMGAKPWMFTVLGNNGIPEAKGVDTTEFQFSPPDKECEMKVKRQQFRQLVQELVPKPWMLKMLIDECKPGALKNPKSQTLEACCTEKNDMVEKRRELRQVIRKMKPGSWMLKVLGNNGIAQAKEIHYPDYLINDNTNIDEKRGEFRSTIKKLGPKPWMTKVVINQAIALSKIVEVEDAPRKEQPDEVVSETELKNECEKMKRKRKVFAEMVRQMGPRQWMMRVLFNQGLKRAQDVKLDATGIPDDEAITKQKRQEFRKFVISTGPKPWMIKIIVNQSRMQADAKVDEQTTEDEKIDENVKTEIVNNRQEFVRTVKQMNPRPWMLKVLANHGVTAAKEVDNSIFGDPASFNHPVLQETKREFRQMIRRIGPKPWMVNVIKNQAVKAKAATTDVADDHLGKHQQNRKRFREVIQEIGAKPWMLEIVRNQLKRANNQKTAHLNQGHEKGKPSGKNVAATEVKKGNATKNKGPTVPHNKKEAERNKSKVATAYWPPSSDDPDDSDEELDADQMNYMYQELVRQMMLNPSMMSPFAYTY